MSKYNDYEYTIIPFGKHKGKYLKDVPDDYIKWAIMNIEDTVLASMFSIELQRRYPKLRKDKTPNK